MTTKKLTLIQKIFEIQKVCEFFKKDESGHNYKYVPGKTVLTAVRKKMDEIGVILEAHLSGELIIEGTQYAQTGFMVWVDVDSCEERKIPWTFAGKQQDISKAFGSGLTYCQRYFILKYFNVPTDEDDPDNIKNSTVSKTETTDFYTTYKFKSGKMAGKTYSEISDKGWLEWIVDKSTMGQDHKASAKKRIDELDKKSGVPASTMGIKHALETKELNESVDVDFGDNLDH